MQGEWPDSDDFVYAVADELDRSFDARAVQWYGVFQLRLAQLDLGASYAGDPTKCRGDSADAVDGSHALYAKIRLHEESR